MYEHIAGVNRVNFEGRSFVRDSKVGYQGRQLHVGEKQRNDGRSCVRDNIVVLYRYEGRSSGKGTGQWRRSTVELLEDSPVIN